MRVATYTEKDKDELLEKLRGHYRRYGKVPVGNSFSPSPSVYKRFFGSWNKAVELAGLSDKIIRKYKIHVSIDGENFFWIIVDNGMFIRNPTEEDLKGAKSVSYNKTNICPRCREENEIDRNELTDKSILYPGNARHEVDKNGKMIERYICNRHRSRDYNRYDPNSWNNIKKSLRDRRICNQNPNHSNTKGDDFQELTCRWRSRVSTIPVKDLNIENNNYTWPIDHSRDSELGILQTKGVRLGIIRQYECWSQNFINLHRALRRGFEFDNLILYCASQDGKFIERIYIIPKIEIMKRKSITITKNPSRGITWYEQYRIKDEEVLGKVNEIWKEIIKKRKY